MGTEDIFKSARKEYERGILTESTVDSSPFSQFTKWFELATRSEPQEPNACAVATTSSDGQPGVRMVLLKSFDESGFVFYTNFESQKGEHLSANPRAAMLFYWPTLEQQVRIEGRCEKVSAAEADLYFSSRPLGSQIAASVSRQSRVAESRDVIDASFKQLEKESKDRQLKRPPHWGGYRLIPTRFEFWQGRENRLHDRICYLLKEGSWNIVRLWP